MFNPRNRFIAVLFVITLFVIQPNVIAQESDPESALDDFIHYSLVANVEFGGLKRNRLYICGTTSLYSMYLNAQAAK